MSKKCYFCESTDTSFCKICGKWFCGNCKKKYPKRIREFLSIQFKAKSSEDRLDLKDINKRYS